jgi:hypothetical protein
MPPYPLTKPLDTDFTDQRPDDDATTGRTQFNTIVKIGNAKGVPIGFFYLLGSEMEIIKGKGAFRGGET